MRQPADLSLFFPPISRDTSTSPGVRAQLVERLRSAILSGSLGEGEVLPSTRALARQLEISRGTVVSVFEELAGEGLVSSRQGSGTTVIAVLPRGPVPNDRPTRPLMPTPDPMGPARWDLTPGNPAARRIRNTDWSSAWRSAMAHPIAGGYPPAAGDLSLREEICRYLQRSRGIICNPADVLVTSGTSDALHLVLAALSRMTPHPTLAVEDPGYPTAHRIALHEGLELIAVPVDDDGLDMNALVAHRRRVDAVLVTPSHQYPMGGRLPLNARLSLLEWAASLGAVVIEDDYDSEFRHIGHPLPAIRSLDGAHTVVHLGSFSKVLTPELRCGYLVLPQQGELRESAQRIRAVLGGGVPGLVQRALAAYLRSGGLQRHIARARRDYTHRRGIVLAQLGGDSPGYRLSALDGGLHAVITLAPSRSATAIVEQLRQDGVAVSDLSSYAVDPGVTRNGFVFGYGELGDIELSAALGTIRSRLASW